MDTPAPFRTPSPGNKPIIAVCGSTGFQGGSVVNHLLRDGRFAVRALTRKPTSFRAKGCYGAFGLTDYFEAFEEEAQHGFNIVNAAKDAKLKHLVMSTVPAIDSIKDVNVCKYKHQTRVYLAKSGVPFTAFTPTFYYNDIFLFDILTKGANGSWMMNFPFPYDIPIPSTAAKDIGAYILAAFLNPSEWIGKDLWVCNELLTLRQFVETFTEVTGFHVNVYESTKEEFYALKNRQFLLGMWEIFEFFMRNHDDNYRYVSPAVSRSLYSQQQTWRDFLVEYREIPIPQPLAIECFHTRERFGDDP